MNGSVCVCTYRSRIHSWLKQHWPRRWVPIRPAGGAAPHFGGCVWHKPPPCANAVRLTARHRLTRRRFPSAGVETLWTVTSSRPDHWVTSRGEEWKCSPITKKRVTVITEAKGREAKRHGDTETRRHGDRAPSEHSEGDKVSSCNLMNLLCS